MRKIILLFITLGLAAASAQPVSPFLEAMSWVPAEPFVKEANAIVNFADISAALAIRDVTPPASWADISDMDFAPALPTVLASGLVQYLTVAGPDYPEVLGLDFFELSGSLEFGQPPEQALVLFGDFDGERVTDAFTRRGYTQSGDLLCPAAGCDSGTQVDVQNRNMANAFGGDLGRSFPVLNSQGAIAGSPSQATVQAIAAVRDGSEISLAEFREVQAVDAVLASWPQVASVVLVNPLSLAVAPDPQRVLDHSDTLAENPLPAYSLLALAATGGGGSESGVLLLVYPDEETANAAAAAVDARLALLPSARTGEPYADELGRSGTLAPARVRVEEATGLAVVVVSITAPVPEEAQARSGRPFMQLLNGGLYARDTLWLLPGG